jgi:hypothetical protein
MDAGVNRSLGIAAIWYTCGIFESTGNSSANPSSEFTLKKKTALFTTRVSKRRRTGFLLLR